MKRIVLLTFIGSLLVALTVWGAPKGKHANRSGKGKPAAHAVSGARSGKVAAPRVSRSAPRVSHNAPRMKRSAPRVSRSNGRQARTKSVGRASASRSPRMEAARTRNARTAERAASARAARTAESARKTRTADRGRTAAPNREKALARSDSAALKREKAQARADAQRRIRTERAKARAEQSVAARTRAAASSNLAVNRQRNLTFARNVALDRDKNVRIRNNWRNDWFRGGDYAPFYNYNRVWHDRSWWRNNYTNIVFVFGGWWYWNSGYWYPAWGYDPYGWYSYDGPIYTGYATVTPDQVMVNVQVALRDWGYYPGPIDGIIGTQSRAALAAFQADNGLAVTSAVDRPTLQALGLA